MLYVEYVVKCHQFNYANQKLNLDSAVMIPFPVGYASLTSSVNTLKWEGHVTSHLNSLSTFLSAVSMKIPLIGRELCHMIHV